jgi:hypothetical protein
MEELYLKLRFGIKIMESLACIIGFIMWARLKPPFWKSFPVYLLVIVCCEFTGWYMYGHGHNRQAKYLYNYFVIPLEFFYMYFLFFKILIAGFRKIVLAVVFLYSILFVIEKIMISKVNWIWMSLSYGFGCAGLFVLITIYFFQLANADSNKKYSTEPFFWVSLGLSIFYVGTFPFYAMPKTISNSNPDLFMFFSWLIIVCNYIMYSLFIKGFLCHREVLK